MAGTIGICIRSVQTALEQAGRVFFWNHFRLSLRNPQTAHAHAGSKFIICSSLVYLIPSSKIGNGSRAEDKRLAALTRTRDRAAI